MICKSCIAKRCDHCANLYNMKDELRDPPTKTWCDCQHKTGIYIDQAVCHHRLYEFGMLFCPSCGKVMDDQTDPIAEKSTPNSDKATITQETAKVRQLSEEELRDARDNYSTS